MNSTAEQKYTKIQETIENLLQLTPLVYSKNVYRHSSGGINYYDSSGQTTSIIKDIIKMCLKSLWGGSISLPVRIYEPHSFLERLTYTWCDYSDFLNSASTCTDPKERFLKVLSAVMSGFSFAFLKQKQSFNPVLGETAQVILPCGMECFMEQVSHHPPITRFEAWEPSKIFKMHGDVTLDYKLGVSSVSGQQTGKTFIELLLSPSTDKENLENLSLETNPDNQTDKDNKETKTETYWYTLPGIKIDGLETRQCYFSGTFCMVSDSFELELHFNPTLVVIQNCFGSFIDQKTCGKLAEIKDFTCGLMKDKTEEKNKFYLVFGSWLDKMYFGTSLFWEVKRKLDNPDLDKFGENFERDDDRILPSDSQNRIDIIELRKMNFTKAQENKHLIEKVQRIEEKMRKR